MYSVNAIRNVCLLGHSGSGKSALAESLLYITGVIDRMGKNADGNTVCDYDPEEIRRNISISTSVVPLEYNGANSISSVKGLNPINSPSLTSIVFIRLYCPLLIASCK